MSNSEYILFKINKIQSFVINKYLFEQIEFKPSKVPLKDNFSYYSSNYFTRVNIRIDFFCNDLNPNFNNSFEISFSSYLGSSISLKLFYEKNITNIKKNKFYLDSYEGSFVNKVDSFCLFLESLLNHTEIKEIIKGFKWSNDYHIDFWGNYK